MAVRREGAGVGLAGLDGPGRARDLAGTARSTVVPSPSCPLSFAPQQKTRPSFSEAQVCAPPAETVAAAPGSPSTGAGARHVAPAAPVPSCPRSFAPQHQTRPARSTAQVWASPAETAAAVLPSGSASSTGARRSSAPPGAQLPAVAASPAPQAARAVGRAGVGAAGRDASGGAVAAPPKTTRAGAACAVVVPSPSCPRSFAPKQAATGVPLGPPRRRTCGRRPPRRTGPPRPRPAAAPARGPSCRPSAPADLAAAAASPAPQAAARVDRAGVLRARGDGAGDQRLLDGRRVRAVVAVVVAQLARLVRPPASESQAAGGGRRWRSRRTCARRRRRSPCGRRPARRAGSP